MALGYKRYYATCQRIECTLADIQAGSVPFENMNHGYDKQYWYFTGLVKAFESRLEISTHPIFLEFKKKMDQVFSP